MLSLFLFCFITASISFLCDSLKHQFDRSINELDKRLILFLPYFSEVQIIAVYNTLYHQKQRDFSFFLKWPYNYVFICLYYKMHVYVYVNKIYLSICYMPPENSSCRYDVSQFYECFITDTVYVFLSERRYTTQLRRC